MIKDNQQHFNRLHVIIDAFVIVISYILAWWLKFSSGILDSPGGALSFGFYMKALVVIVPLYLILYYAFNLYTPKRVQGRRLEFSNVVMANIMVLCPATEPMTWGRPMESRASAAALAQPERVLRRTMFPEWAVDFTVSLKMLENLSDSGPSSCEGCAYLYFPVDDKIFTS